MPAKIPEKLGPYIIERRIGRGGMGTIYAGHHKDTGTPVAIKALASSLSDDESFRLRFEKEIEALRQLRHPNIVQLYGYGQEDDSFFYSMELVQGRSLEEEIASGRRFTWRETLTMGMQVCAALRCAHDRGIIHRDLKPANLLLSVDGTVKLSDFGIATLFGSTKLTDAGNVIGTIEYMAPEQATLMPITNRTDLYSFGAVLVALMSGHPPFLGKNLLEIIHQHAQYKAKRPSQLGIRIPPPMDELIGRLLERDPEKRPRSAYAVLRQFEAILDDYDDDNLLEDTANYALLNRGQENPAEVIDRTAPTGSIPAESSPENMASSIWYQPLPQQGGSLETPSEIGRRERSMLVKPSGVENVAGANASNDSKSQEHASGLSGAVSTGGAASTGDAASSTGSQSTNEHTSEHTGVRHFVRVEKELTPEEIEQSRPLWVRFWGTSWGGLLILLIFTACFGVVAARGIAFWAAPPSADRLYYRILRLSESEKNASSYKLEKDVQDFLSYYANDPRAEKVQDIQSILELNQLEKRIRLFSRSAQASQPMHPVERDYQLAIEHLATRPDLALQDLNRFLVFYDMLGKHYAGRKDKQAELRKINPYRELARRQVARLHQLLDKEVVSWQDMLQSTREAVQEMSPPTTEDDLRQMQTYRRSIELRFGDAAKDICERLEQLEKEGASHKNEEPEP